MSLHPPTAKEAPIRALMVELERVLPAGTYHFPDYWDGDLCALAVEKADVPNHLVYLSCFARPPGEFEFECELPDDSEQGACTTETGRVVGTDEVIALVRRHLDI